MATMEGDLIRQEATVLAQAIAAGEVSSEEVTTAHLDRIAAVDERVHAFLHVLHEDAIESARAVDRKRAAGEPLGGAPVVVARAIPLLAEERLGRARAHAAAGFR